MSKALRALGSCATLEEEYWYHVSDQDRLPLAAVAERNTLFTDLNVLANGFFAAVSDEPETFIASALLEKPSLINELRVLTGVSNKRLYLELSYLFSRTLDDQDNRYTLSRDKPSELNAHKLGFFEQLLKSSNPERAHQAACVIARRLLQNGLLEMLAIYAELAPEKRKRIVDSLILPKEIQQREAKIRGHGVEACLAQHLRFLNVHFEPAFKIEAPMGSYDPKVTKGHFERSAPRAGPTWSFDLIILQEDEVRICVQGLIHSSDPGQFGVNKIDSSITIRSEMDSLNRHTEGARDVQLWGLVDGVGYAENKVGTINRLLNCLHQFVQVNSIYKAACALHKARLCEIAAIRLEDEFYSSTSAGQMAERYVPKDVRLLSGEDEADSTWKRCDAGYGTVYLK